MTGYHMIDLYHKIATYKQHKRYRNATVRAREDKRTKDKLYKAVKERYY